MRYQRGAKYQRGVRSERGIGVPRTRGYLGHHEVEHVKVGAVDGPSEAVVKQVQVYICIYVVSLSPPKKEGHSQHAHLKTTTRAVIVH